mmetsp:Transcript_12971/g.51554  ORF Transcript_12971/g.51554 Transcript_12971/m.51554 type:complete len:80 (-) Transcript_12971:257-496(-)
MITTTRCSSSLPPKYSSYSSAAPRAGEGFTSLVGVHSWQGKRFYKLSYRPSRKLLAMEERTQRIMGEKVPQALVRQVLV